MAVLTFIAVAYLIAIVSGALWVGVSRLRRRPARVERQWLEDVVRELEARRLES